MWGDKLRDSQLRLLNSCRPTKAPSLVHLILSVSHPLTPPKEMRLLLSVSGRRGKLSSGRGHKRCSHQRSCLRFFLPPFVICSCVACCHFFCLCCLFHSFSLVGFLPVYDKKRQVFRRKNNTHCIQRSLISEAFFLLCQTSLFIFFNSRRSVF